MDRSDLLASVLVDEALTTAMMPWACPSDFGPANRYRLEELIGAGPRSLVYKAHDRLLSEARDSTRRVAIKIMRGGLGGAAEPRSPDGQEGGATATLSGSWTGGRTRPAAHTS